MNSSLRVAVNAVNIKVAGGLAVTLNFLKVVQTSMPHVQLEVLCPNDANFKPYAGKNINLHFIPKYMESPLQRLWGDHVWLKRKVRQINPDVIFTMANIAIPSNYPQAVLFMLPYAIYLEDAQVWKRIGRKANVYNRLVNVIFKSRLKYATAVFPQTDTSLSRLKRFYPSIGKLTVIPMAYSTLGKEKMNGSYKSFFDREPGYRYLLCLTRYYPHKNIEIFLQVARLMKASNASFKIITTIDAGQCVETAAFLQQVNNEGLSEIVINLGNVPINDVPALYEQVDALILPTLLESFSATYLDSFFYRKPVFTSKRDFAVDVCGDSAFYFDPLSAQSILDTLNAAYADEKLMEQKIESGFERVQKSPDWNAVGRKYIEQLTLLTKHNG